MLKKRIVPCLDIKDGRTVKGVNFVALRDAGDPVELAKTYSELGADELVFLDITATHERRKTLSELVRKVAQAVTIPFTVGGGITSVEDARLMLQNGADKIAVNSAAVRDPQLIHRLAEQFGNQCVVVAIDAKNCNGTWKVFLNGGRLETDLELFSWAKQAVALGAGELLFTSMDHDGTKEGFAIDALAQLCKEVNVPVIASGGCGKIAHFISVFQEAGVDAALAASVFHFGEIAIGDLKKEMVKNNIPTRL